MLWDLEYKILLACLLFHPVHGKTRPQKTRAGNLLIRSLAQFAQIKWVTVSYLLRSLKTNEGPWANRSGRSEEMSDHERITQVAQEKWATVSDSIRSLKGNEQMSKSLQKFCLIKSKILFFNFFSMLYIWWAMWVNRSGCSPKLSDVSESLRLLNKNEQPRAIRSGRSEEMSDREQITQATHQKWANKWIAHFFKQITHSLIFGQKTSDSLGKPMSVFPALSRTSCIDFTLEQASPSHLEPAALISPWNRLVPVI